jgi:hypothetical protein
MTPLDLADKKAHADVVEYLKTECKAKMASELPEDLRRMSRGRLELQIAEGKKLNLGGRKYTHNFFDGKESTVERIVIPEF